MATLPDWMPMAEWDGYLAMRKKIKKPATDRAITLAIALLTSFHDRGEDVAAILDQSTMNSWQGIFPLSERRAEQRPDNRKAFPALGKHGQATANNLQDWLEDFT